MASVSEELVQPRVTGKELSDVSTSTETSVSWPSAVYRISGVSIFISQAYSLSS